MGENESLHDRAVAVVARLLLQLPRGVWFHLQLNPHEKEYEANPPLKEAANVHSLLNVDADQLLPVLTAGGYVKGSRGDWSHIYSVSETKDMWSAAIQSYCKDDDLIVKFDSHYKRHYILIWNERTTPTPFHTVKDIKKWNGPYPTPTSPAVDTENVLYQNLVRHLISRLL